MNDVENKNELVSMNVLEKKLFGKLLEKDEITITEISEDESIIINNLVRSINQKINKLTNAELLCSGYIGNTPFIVLVTPYNEVFLALPDRIIEIPKEKSENNIFGGRVYVKGNEEIEKNGKSLEIINNDGLYERDYLCSGVKVSNDKMINSLRFLQVARLFETLPSNQNFNNVRNLLLNETGVVYTNRCTGDNNRSLEASCMWDSLESLINGETPRLIGCDIEFNDESKRGKRFGYFIKNDEGVYEGMNPNIYGTPIPNSSFIWDYNEFIEFIKSLGLEFYSEKIQSQAASEVREPDFIDSIRKFVNLHMYCAQNGINVSSISTQINNINIGLNVSSNEKKAFYN